MFSVNFEVTLQNVSSNLEDLKPVCTIEAVQALDSSLVPEPRNNQPKCGQVKVQTGKILGGKEATPNNYNWMVLILIRTRSG